MEVESQQPASSLAVKVLLVPELFDLIQAYLTLNSDLVSLTQVSKAFFNLFGPIFWHTVEIKTEQQHDRFVNTPEVRNALQKHGPGWIRVIRIRTPKSLTPFLHQPDGQNILLTQLHTLERLFFEDLIPKGVDFQPFLDDGSNLLGDPYAESFYLEQEHFHRARGGQAWLDSRMTTTTSSASTFWLHQRRIGILRLAQDSLQLSVEAKKLETRLREVYMDLGLVRKAHEVMTDCQEIIRKLALEEEHEVDNQTFEPHNEITTTPQDERTMYSTEATATTSTSNGKLVDVFFYLFTIREELKSEIHSRSATTSIRQAAVNMKPLPEESRLVDLMNEYVTKIGIFETQALQTQQLKQREDQHARHKLRTEQWEYEQDQQRHQLLLQQFLYQYSHHHQQVLARQNISIEEHIERFRREQEERSHRARLREMDSWDSNGHSVIRPPYLAVSALVLDSMRAFLEEQFTSLSMFQITNTSQSTTITRATSTPDPFSGALPAWPAEKDLWDYVDTPTDVDAVLVPFLEQCCPNLQSLGSIYFPFQSWRLLCGLSRIGNGNSLRTLSMISPELNCIVDSAALFAVLRDLSPRLETLRFGAQVGLAVAAAAASAVEQEEARPGQEEDAEARVDALIATCLERWSTPLRGLRTLILEGSVEGLNSALWTRFMERCPNLRSLNLMVSFPDPILHRLTSALTQQNPNMTLFLPRLQEISLSGGREAQDKELSEFLEACSGVCGGVIDANRSRIGVSRIRLTNIGNFGQHSLKVFQRCYNKTLTHLTLHGCFGPLALHHEKPSSPLTADDSVSTESTDHGHPIVWVLAEFERLQVVDLLPVQRVNLLPSTALHGTVWDAEHLIRSHDLRTSPAVSETGRRGPAVLSFVPWECFSALRVLKLILGGDVLVRTTTQRPTVPGAADEELATLLNIFRTFQQNHRKLYRVLGSLVVLEELHLGTATMPMTATYTGEVQVTTGTATATSLASTSIPTPIMSLTSLSSTLSSSYLPIPVATTAKETKGPWLRQATIRHFLTDHEKRIEIDQQKNCLLMTLESGLGEMAELKALKILNLSGMDHRIGLPELEWMVEQWPDLREIPGLKRPGWESHLSEWIKSRASFWRYS
ncbi:hypothetical protein BGZ83_008802 [Gryganskiella cystojenkinii]|nr:hypothetical protein BGZ83_008802 [Gryganskiella cystojenkinii]